MLQHAAGRRSSATHLSQLDLSTRKCLCRARTPPRLACDCWCVVCAQNTYTGVARHRQDKDIHQDDSGGAKSLAEITNRARADPSHQVPFGNSKFK